MPHKIKLHEIGVAIYNRTDGNMYPKFDEPGLVAKRRRNLREEISPAKVVRIKAQGLDNIVDLAGKEFENDWTEIACDGLITRDSSYVLVLMPADCIPLVVYSVQTNIFGLIHVSRKGASLGVHQKAIKYIVDTYKEDIKDLRFYLGPSIHSESYFFDTVDSDQLQDPVWAHFIAKHDNRYHVDLIGYTIRGLKELGVLPDAITYSPVDTGSDLDYFSHARSRRTGEVEGQNTIVVFKEGGSSHE
jgi:copper oxidase (laccase) domain-containing protein